MKELSRILVIDDDADLASTMQIILTRKGFRVDMALNAAEAKETLRNKTFDLLMIDKLLSGTDGRDLCASLRKTRKLAETPIIMFSAHANAEEECLEAGADDFIAKPFDLNELFDKIHYLLNRNGATSH